MTVASRTTKGRDAIDLGISSQQVSPPSSSRIGEVEVQTSWPVVQNSAGFPVEKLFKKFNWILDISKTNKKKQEYFEFSGNSIANFHVSRCISFFTDFTRASSFSGLREKKHSPWRRLKTVAFRLGFNGRRDAR